MCFCQHDMCWQVELFHLARKRNNCEGLRITVRNIVCQDQHRTVPTLHTGAIMVTKLCKPDLILLRDSGRRPVVSGEAVISCVAAFLLLFGAVVMRGGAFMLGAATLVDVLVHMDLPATRQNPCVAFLSPHSGFHLFSPDTKTAVRNPNP